jgi:hypothetical protein
VFFANFSQTVFGDTRINGGGGDYGTIHIYSGFKDFNEQVPVREINVYQPSSIPSAIAELKKIAQV